MGNILDKCAVLDRIKQFYKLKGNADLARFLEVAPNTITNWYSRKSFDIDSIYTKCVDVNFQWLLTGNGPMIIQGNNNYPLNNNRLKIKDETTSYNKIEKEENIESEKIYLDLIKSQEEKIQSLNRTIGRLEYEIEILKQNQIEEPVVRDVGCAAAG